MTPYCMTPYSLGWAPVCRAARRGSLFAAALMVFALPPAAGGGEDGPRDERFFRGVAFRRGDTNSDGRVNIADAIDTLNVLFLSTGRSFSCLNASDSNSDHRVNVTDAVYTLNFLFLGTAEPATPGPFACGVDRRAAQLPCEEHGACPDDFALVAHVLGRITFGPDEDLYTRIQTRAELVEYIEEQLEPPARYDPAVHEPELHARVADLEIGFAGDATRPDADLRLKAMLLLYAVESRWQLLHVVTQFWNNHFHTQVASLRDNFFRRGERGGAATPSTPVIFAAADTDSSGEVSETEWDAFRGFFPAANAWGAYGRDGEDGLLSLEEFLARPFAGRWKYGTSRDQLAAAADLERREYDFYRRLAFGRFRTLLDGCAKSAAMLIYLNGFENTVLSPNENFAREFFELFSVGADRLYTQRDIEELSRVFTGWTVGWVRRDGYAPEDIHFVGRPESLTFPLDRKHAPPLDFPTTEFWDDDLHAWAFLVGTRDQEENVLEGLGHDWGRKRLFLQRYGGVDSLGDPAPASAALTIEENTDNRTVDEALREFNRVLARVAGFRDTAKFISTKLIQLFVTDDLSRLEKSGPVPPDVLERFQAVDLDRDGAIEPGEWGTPLPLVLPNGRPPAIFADLDTDQDGRVTPDEYREPDLVLDCIRAWVDSGGEIRALLRTILLSEELLSLKHHRSKVKTPFEFAASLARALDGESSLTELFSITEDLRQAGMDLFDFPDPTGESELGFDWVHTLGVLERLKLASRGANPGSAAERRFTWDPERFRSRWRLDSAERAVDFLSALLLGGEILEAHRRLAIGVHASAAGDPLAATAAFLASLPEFQKQ
jgi:hypothetical protein